MERKIMSDITLTSTARLSLLSLQETSRLSERTQGRLSTGRNVNKVTDGAVAYFRNRALVSRISDFEAKREDIDQSTAAVSTALQGLDAIDTLLRQARGLIDSARSQTTSERQEANRQFTTVLKQIYQLVEDTSYQGTNLINNTNTQLNVRFGVRTSSTLVIDGTDLNKTAAGGNALFTGTTVFSSQGGAILSGIFTGGTGFTQLGSNNTSIALADTAVNRIDDAIGRIRTVVANYGNDVAILQSRLNFTDNYTNELQSGADRLVEADLNEEGANLVALQTRQQLGIQALSIAGQQQQAILGLF